MEAECLFKMSANFCYARHVTFQKIVFFIGITVRFPNLTFWRKFNTSQDRIKWRSGNIDWK
jgi:hypothetical protein